jgi:hypothetical protein
LKRQLPFVASDDEESFMSIDASRCIHAKFTNIVFARAAKVRSVQARSGARGGT